MDIFVKAYELNEYLKSLQIIKDVYEAEQNMENDLDTKVLIQKYQDAITNYNDAVRYKLDITSYQKSLSETKANLYSSPLVKEYLNKLKKANEFLDSIKKELFSDIIDFEEKGKECINRG